jgi:hypothetical protein
MNAVVPVSAIRGNHAGSKLARIEATYEPTDLNRTEAARV